MMKLFKNIRRKLLTENRFNKYLLYAIGEIVLVVIGILIALWINNWNEERIEIKKQNNLFNNLKVDFNSRLLELTEMSEAKKEGINATHKLNLIINNKQFNEPDKIYALLANTFNAYLFNEQFKMLDVLFYTGTINDIKNEKLKRLLVEWPQNVEEMLEEQRIHNNLYINYLDIIGKHIPIRLINEKFSFRNYGLPEGQPVTQKANFEGLFSDNSFENILAEREILTHIMIKDNQILIDRANKIIALLESEY